MKLNITHYFFLLALLLSVLGVIFIFSASTYWSEVHYKEEVPFYIKQLVFLVLAIMVYVFISRVSLEQQSLWNFFYGVSIILLIIVLIPGIGVERNGSRSWLAIGPILLQPAELAKITTLALLSFKLAAKRSTDSTVKLNHFIIAGIPLFLIMLQPDFGSAFILAVAVFVLFFIAQYPYRFYIGIVIIGVVGILYLIISEPYRLVRIKSFIDPWQDPLGSGFQAVQSLLAIGSGGLFGQGFLKSRQKYLYLPEPQNDFIFSIILEEIGFVGGFFVICIFACFLFTGYLLAKQAVYLKQFYMISSLICMLAIQIFLNLGVVTGVLPVTGVTLPFISYGGSSLLIVWITVAIILNTAKQ